MAQEWDIRPRADACGKCEQPFQDQQPYRSVLTWDKDGYVRADYCEKCWGETKDALQTVSAWQGTYKAPPPEPEEPLKKETAESLLRGLMEDSNPARKNVIFILAVMLERKRTLVERAVQAQEDGTVVRVYEHRKTGETFLIPDPRLQFNQLEQVQREVAAMLSGAAEEERAESNTRDKESAGDTEKPEGDGSGNGNLDGTAGGQP